MIHPSDLVAPASPVGYPAPYIVLVLLKGLGFVLHMWPMHLWFAGLLLALLAARFGGEHARVWSGRLAKQMPVFIAVGINLGILALLFLQVAYYRVFYPATILMAWAWFSVFVSLTFAYYGTYLYEMGLRAGRLTRVRRVIGWAAAALFIWDGFVFANALSLTETPGDWSRIWMRTHVAGAVLGTGLHAGAASLWARWLMMFGLALTTTGAYAAADAALLAVSESDAYKQWAAGFALKVHTAGLLWFAAAGSWYVFGTWEPLTRQVMFQWPMALLTIATALSPGLPWLLLFLQRRGLTRVGTWAVVGAQFGMLAANAVSRQIVQNLRIHPFAPIGTEPVNAEWSSIFAFVVSLVAGLIVLAWILRTLLRAGAPQPSVRG